MTLPRLRPLPLLAVLLLAAVWAVASYLLWRSSVPASLRLPHLDPHAYFSSAQLRSSEAFSGVADWLAVGTTISELIVLALYARYGSRFARESAAGPIGTGVLLGMLGFALVWIPQLPFGVGELWWQRRHHLTHVGYVAFLFGDWLSLGGRFVGLTVVVAIVMGLGRALGRHWWIAAAPVFAALAALSAFVGPYLLGTHPLGNRTLAASARRLESREGIGRVPVVVENVRDITTLPNAEAAGIGPSRRIVLWDTMLGGRFDERELRVVVAHEIGHLAHGHIWKQLGWFALFAFPGTFLLSLAARRRGGIHRPDAIPLTLLVLVVLELLAVPAQNAISRHLEAEADWSALRATRDPAAAAALFRRFVPTTLDDPDPSTLDYVLFENHPTIMQRIAMTVAWRRAGGRQPRPVRLVASRG